MCRLLIFLEPEFERNFERVCPGEEDFLLHYKDFTASCEANKSDGVWSCVVSKPISIPKNVIRLIILRQISCKRGCSRNGYLQETCLKTKVMKQAQTFFWFH